MRSQSPAARMGASYAAAFIGFKLGILAWVALLDHGWSAFSGEVLLRQFLRYGAIFAGPASCRAGPDRPLPEGGSGLCSWHFPRSEERRVGKACDCKCRSRGAP